MKIQTLFFKRLFMSVALGSLLTSSGFAMDEQEQRPTAAVAVVQLTAEQDKFLSDFQSTVVSGVVLPIKDLVKTFEELTNTISQKSYGEREYFGESYLEEPDGDTNPDLLRYNRQIEESYSTIKDALSMKFPSLIKYYDHGFSLR